MVQQKGRLLGETLSPLNWPNRTPNSITKTYKTYLQTNLQIPCPHLGPPPFWSERGVRSPAPTHRSGVRGQDLGAEKKYKITRRKTLPWRGGGGGGPVQGSAKVPGAK